MSTRSHGSILEEICGIIDGEVPRETCETTEAIRWLVESVRKGRKALRQLEEIRTEKLAARGLAEEATAISAARILLDNSIYSYDRPK